MYFFTQTFGAKMKALALLSTLLWVQMAGAQSAPNTSPASVSTEPVATISTPAINTPATNTPATTPPQPLPAIDTITVQNATLLRENDALKAQVEVLTHERTGQIFLYGALVAIVCFGMGIGLGVFIKRRSF